MEAESMAQLQAALDRKDPFGARGIAKRSCSCRCAQLQALSDPPAFMQSVEHARRERIARPGRPFDRRTPAVAHWAASDCPPPSCTHTRARNTTLSLYRSCFSMPTSAFATSP